MNKPTRLDLGNDITKDVINLLKTKPSNKKKDNANVNSNIPVVKYEDLFKIFKFNKDKVEFTETIYEILPNIKLAIEIVVSSILSPNEMRKAILSYNIDSKYLPVTMITPISNKIKQHIKDKYDLEDKLQDIVEESMFIKGSYAELIVPQKFINDNIKNITTLESHIEDLSKVNLKFINHVYDRELGLEITDNIDLLFAKDKYNKKREVMNNSIITGLESDMLSEIETILSIDPDVNSNDVPIIKKMNSESVIPIADKDDPSKHYGYFVILDEKGTPVNKNPLQPHSNILDLLNNNKQSQLDRMLNRVKKTLSAVSAKEFTLENVNELKEKLIISKLQEAAKGSNLEDVLNTDELLKLDVLDILLERILKNKKTKILYIPKELMVYYAYEYRKNGTGRPLLEKVLILASIRVIIMFSSLMAYVRSSIPTTIVEADIDDEDPDPSRTMEKIKAEVVRNREFSLPIGLLKLEDITTWLHKTGYSFVFSGSQLPATKISVREETLDINPVNTDLEEMIDKFIYNTFGLTPEQLNDAESANFATTIIASNRLFARRIDMYQKVYNKLITEHISKILRQDGVIKNEIMDMLTNDKNYKSIIKFIKSTITNEDLKKRLLSMSKEQLATLIYIDILNNLDVSLPEPVVTDTDTIAEMYKNFKNDLEDMLDTLITEDIFPDEMVGELSGKIDNIKSVIEAVTLIKWANEHNYMSEITQLFNTGKDGKPVMMVLEEYSTYIDLLQSTIVPFLKEIDTKKKNIEKELDKIGNDEDHEENLDNETEEEDNKNTEKEDNENKEENENKEDTEENNEDNEDSDLDFKL